MCMGDAEGRAALMAARADIEFAIGQHAAITATPAAKKCQVASAKLKER